MASSTLSASQFILVGPLAAIHEESGSGQAEFANGERTEAWKQIIDQLLCIRQLEEDWDGQGAAAPAAAVVDRALEWVGQMRRHPRAIPPSQAVAGVQGEVYLEWQSGAFYLVAEIPSPTRVEWMLVLEGQTNQHWVTEGALQYYVAAAG